MNWLQRFGLAKATLPTAARQEERQPEVVATTQGYPSWQPSPFASLLPWSKVPQNQNLEITEQMLQMIPGHNGALKQIANLVGCPELESEDKDALQEHNDWRSRLQVNRSAVGFDVWFTVHNINHLTYGLSAAEVVLTGSKTDVYALNELHPRTLELRPRARAYGLDLVQVNQPFGAEKVLNPDLILRSVHDLRDDHPWGKGLLWGTNYASQIYTNMLTSLSNTWERFGVPIVIAIQKPPTGPGGLSDPRGNTTGNIASDAKAAIDAIMKSRAEGKPRNLVMVGDWEFSIMGAEGDALDIVGPGRHLHEQFVANYGLPPMLLGYQWQAGERIGWVQAGLATQMVEAIRSHLTPQIEYLFRLRQALVGRPFEWKITWKAPSLIDRGEDAKAELTEAQAEIAKQKADQDDWRNGVIRDWEYAQRRRPELKDKTEAQVRAMCPDLLPQPMMMAMGPGGIGGEEETPAGENRPFGRSDDLIYSKAVWGRNGNGRTHG